MVVNLDAGRRDATIYLVCRVDPAKLHTHYQAREYQAWPGIDRSLLCHQRFYEAEHVFKYEVEYMHPGGVPGVACASK